MIERGETPSGRMVSMNAAASRLVDSDSGIWLDRAGHLRLPEPR